MITEAMIEAAAKAILVTRISRQLGSSEDAYILARAALEAAFAAQSSHAT
jgi:hypothetical protein